jgi:hypothetical protein
MKYEKKEWKEEKVGENVPIGIKNHAKGRDKESLCGNTHNIPNVKERQNNKQ